MNPLLRRQLRRSGLDPSLGVDPDALAEFLERVQRTYEEADRSRYLLERSLQISSEEMQAVYEELRSASDSEVASQRDRLASIVNSLDEGVLLVNASGTVLVCNHAAAAMIGMSEEELLGTDGFALVDLSGGEDPFSSTRLMAEAWEGGIFTDSDAQLHRADGGKIPVKVHIVGVSDTGDAVVSFLDRRTELEQERRIEDSEARYEMLWNNTPVATFEMDLSDVARYFDALRAAGIDDLMAYANRHPDQIVEAAERIIILNVNEEAMELFGYDGPEPLLGPFNPDRLNTQDLRGFFGLALAAWKGVSSASVEMGLVTRDGEPIHVVAGWDAREVDGEVDLSRVILTLTDITARKSEEERIAELIEQKDDFLASISHQIRTPLTHVMTSAELLRDAERLPKADLEELLGMIIRGASEMRSFVDDLIASARTEDGILVIKPELVDVGRTCDSVLETIVRIYQRKSARNATAGVTAWADPLRLDQILRNLLMNAFQHGGPNVEISAVRSQGRTIVEVRDDGIGVPPAVESQIFDAYWGTGRPGDSGSLGIGLTVSRRLAEAMGGSLSHSRRGITTVFALELPSDAPPSD